MYFYQSNMIIQKKLKNYEFIQDSKDLLGYGFVYSVLFNDTLIKNIDDYKRILGISRRGFWYNIEVNKESYKNICCKEDIISCVSSVLKKNIKYVIINILSKKSVFMQV